MKKLFMKKTIIYFLFASVWIALLAGLLLIARISFIGNQQPILRVCAWGDIFDQQFINQFEEETGIKILLSSYSSNEELLLKLKATKGSGVDVIVPSDYTVPLLIHENLLQKIDKKRIEKFEHLDRRLLGQPFDANNDYSLPFCWEIFALGIDRNFFSGMPIDESWSLIFKQPSIKNYTIAMVNDPLAAVLFGLQYMYGTATALRGENIQRVVDMLIQQRAWVKAYVDFRADYYLVTHNCPVVVASSSYIIKGMREYSEIDCIIPREGTFITIENIALPRGCAHEDAAYTFINFMYRSDAMRHQFKKHGVFPACHESISQYDISDPGMKIFEKIRTSSIPFSFFYIPLPAPQLQDIWVTVKC